MKGTRISAIAVALLALSALVAAANAQASGGGGAAVYEPRVLTPSQASEDIALLRRALEDVHPGLHRYTPKVRMDSAFARLERRAASPVGDGELYVEISRLLAEIHCDHTKAEYPAALAQHRRQRPTHFPFRFRLFDRRMYVASSDSAQPPLARGTEIVAINGVPVSKILTDIEPLIAYDGLTSFVRATKLEADPDLMGSDFEHFYPLLYGFPTELRLTVRDTGRASPRAVVVRPITYQAWSALPWDGAQPGADFASALSWRMLGGGRTAYLRVGTFVNYRKPVNPDSAYGAIFRAMRAAGAESLVVDLRRNGGGSDDARDALLRFLVDTPAVLGKPSRLKAVRYGDLPRYVQSWGDRKALFEPPLERFTQLPDGSYEVRPDTAAAPAPSPDRFTGPVTVLAGPRNGSGATMLIAVLRGAGRVRVVGEPTGGSAEGPTGGPIFFVKLPNSGITVRVPVQWNRTNVRDFRAGYGVAPDITAAPTLRDFLAGRDVALEAAQR